MDEEVYESIMDAVCDITKIYGKIDDLPLERIGSWESLAQHFTEFFDGLETARVALLNMVGRTDLT